MFTASPEETRLICEIQRKGTSKRRIRYSIRRLPPNTISLGAAEILFLSYDLPRTIVLSIINLADQAHLGYLTRNGLGIAVRLIGWAQSGIEISEKWIKRCGPLAVIHDFPEKNGYCCSRLQAPQSSVLRVLPLLRTCSANDMKPEEYPPLMRDRREKYTDLFNKKKPRNGVLRSHKVWEAFSLSKLPVARIAQIWDLVDVNCTGFLYLFDFIIGLYFIDGLVHRTIHTIPTTVPSFLYEQARCTDIPCSRRPCLNDDSTIQSCYQNHQQLVAPLNVEPSSEDPFESNAPEKLRPDPSSTDIEAADDSQMTLGPPSPSLRDEIGQLRTLVEGLMRENGRLKTDVMLLQQNNPVLEPERLRATLPPPYED